MTILSGIDAVASRFLVNDVDTRPRAEDLR